MNILLRSAGWRLYAIAFCALAAGACTDKSSQSFAGVDPTNFLRFVEVHETAGIRFVHGYHRQRSEIQPVLGGVACADYDRDGYPDLYIVSGDSTGNLLYHNERDGTFKEVGENTGTRLFGGAWSGSTFADINGDGFQDLFICGIADTRPCILINNGDGTFVDRTPGSGFDEVLTDSFCVAFGDIDGDDDLDVFMTQWQVVRGKGEKSQHLWRNNGKGVFTDISASAGITAVFAGTSGVFTDLSFTPNFVDVDSDGDLDLLIAGDLGTNRVLRNDGKGVFSKATPSDVFSDHASGAAVGDYDNDGDLDWFVSGISGPGFSGNHLYQNNGTGGFLDMTQVAGVGKGGWGWGASFSDFDNDGYQDLIQVNGFGTSPQSAFGQFFRDPTRLFMNNRDGSFTERSAALGLDDSERGRGVVCFDYDRDGDLDIFIVNSLGAPSLWRNDNGNIQNYLSVALAYKAGNPRGIGARVTISAGGMRQIRELRVGCNYVSQNPAEVHFGLGAATVVDSVEVRWPDGTKTTQTDVKPRQRLVISY